MRVRAARRMAGIVNRIGRDLKRYWPAILLFAVWNGISRAAFHAFCPQLILTGFPCAGCGLTRAVFFILTGRIARGMALNPSAPLWMSFLIWFLWNRYVCGRTPKSALHWLGAVAALTLLIYMYRMVRFFPGNPPLVYYKNNILRNLHRLFSYSTINVGQNIVIVL